MTEERQKRQERKGKTLSWKAAEYEHREKTPDWFWALGILAVAGAATAVIFSNMLFAILILIGAFVLALYAARKPETVEFELSERGVRIGEEFHPYRELESFYVSEPEDDYPKLLLTSTKVLAPHIIIPLEGVVADDVREFLEEYLPEEEQDEPLGEKIMGFFGF